MTVVFGICVETFGSEHQIPCFSLWLCVRAMVDQFPVVSSLKGRFNPFLVGVEKSVKN